MPGFIARTRWGWSLYVGTVPTEEALVASSDDAATLWPLAQSLDMRITA